MIRPTDFPQRSLRMFKVFLAWKPLDAFTEKGPRHFSMNATNFEFKTTQPTLTDSIYLMVFGIKKLGGAIKANLID